MKPDKTVTGDDNGITTGIAQCGGDLVTVLDFEKIVASELEVFEAATCKFMMETIIKKQQLFDIRRTFNGYMYDTIEIRDDAEKQYMEFFAEDENVVEMIDFLPKLGFNEFFTQLQKAQKKKQS